LSSLDRSRIVASRLFPVGKIEGIMKMWRLMAGLLIVATSELGVAQVACSEDTTWLVQYDGQEIPAGQWTLQGKGKTEIVHSALHLVDDSPEQCCYRASWKADPAMEIVVEARVKMGAVVGYRGKQSLWPWRDGAPVGLLLSDGRHREGFVLMPRGVRTFTDWFCEMNTTDDFHVYRLVIHDTDMSIEVDGVRRIVGQNAFWKPAESPEPFIQFGSNSNPLTGDAHW
jgi:hypothetical protein